MDDTPRQLGKYRILRVVGRGGMGVVYEAEDPALRRRVALKVVREADVHPQLLKRFQREAMIAAHLRHPNIVPVHEVSDDGPYQFMVMDFIEGTTLEALLRKRADRGDLLRILENVAAAVGHAHEHGVVHRDLKPANVLLDSQGRVFLTDFGLAHVDTLEDRLTKTHAVMGTPMYMAPEQVEGDSRAIDARTDVYALGVLLYEILAGRLPFRAETPAALYSAILHDDPETISDAERDLQVICLKALEKRREARYANGKEFAADLRRFRAGDPIHARPHSAAAELWRKARRHRGVLIPTAAALLLAAALGAVLVRKKPAPPPPRERPADRSREEADAILELARPALDAEARYYYDEKSDFAEFRRTVRDALPTIEKAAARAPGFAKPHYHLGRAWEHLGEEERAEAAWREALRLDPAYAPARYRLGRLLLERAFLLRVFSTAGRKNPTHAAAEALIGEAVRLLDGIHLEEPLEQTIAAALLAYVRDDPDEMRRTIRDGLERFRGKRGVEEIHWLAGLADRDVAIYTEAIRLRPRYAIALYCRGCRRFQDGDFADAERDFTAALEVRPRLVHALINRGAARGQLGRAKEAIDDLTRALELRPGSADALSNRGFARKLSGDREGAKRDYRLAIEADPACGAHYNLGLLLLEEGNREEAIAEFTREIEHTPDHAGAFRSRADARFGLRDIDGAFADADALIRMKPDRPEGYEIRGALHAALGQYREAFEHYDQASRRAPTEPTYYYNRALMRYQFGERDQAIADIEKALEVAPKNWPNRKAVQDLLDSVRKK